MNNLYNLESMEICRTMEDFVYDSNVKVEIPALNIYNNKRNSINKNNIMNLDTSKFNLDLDINEGYISVFIGKEHASIDCLHDHIDNDIHKHTIPTSQYHSHKICSSPSEHEYSIKGKKGTEFIIGFIGGDLNKPYIIGGYNNA